MPGGYIPDQDANALIWMQAFSNGIFANPTLYGLTPADAAAIKNAVDIFDSAMSVANTPTTRTPPSVSAKDTARNAAEQICRQFAIIIKHNDGISDDDKIAIGVRPINTEREPVEAPTTSPLLSIIAATPGAHTVRFSDSLTPDSRAKPFGASSLQLFVAVDESEISDPDLAKFVGAFTRNPIGVDFSAVDEGKEATYFARWASRKGDTGPWSLPISMRVAA